MFGQEVKQKLSSESKVHTQWSGDWEEKESEREKGRERILGGKKIEKMLLTSVDNARKGNI